MKNDKPETGWIINFLDHLERERRLSKYTVRNYRQALENFFGWLRQELGPDIDIAGGPHIELLRSGTAEQVRQEVKRILATGITEGGRFILREANNLAPHTPLENLWAMYQAGKEFGSYS